MPVNPLDFQKSRTFDAKDALRQLIEGTGLEIASVDGATIVLQRQTNVSLTTVIVTAQKRSQAAQSVPIDMTTFSAKELDTYRVQNLQDVAHLTPGLLVSAFSESDPTIAIRGVSNTFEAIGVSKPVGIVVDDVFIPRNSAANFALFDLDSIDVLKGPQGTLFGRNVTGGAIVINTRPASYDGLELEGQETLGNLSDRQLQGFVSAPLNDQGNAAFKLTADVHSRDGYGHDLLTGSQEDDLHSQNFRGQFRFKLSSDLEAIFNTDYSQDWNHGRTLSLDTLDNVRESELGIPQSYARIISGSSFKIDWKVPGGGDLTSITAYRRSESSELDSEVGENYLYLPPHTTQYVERGADQVGTFSQEVRYASQKWAQGDFVAGVYYLNEDGARQYAEFSNGPLTDSTLNLEHVSTTSYAVFGDGTLHLPSSFDLTGGVRYTYDAKAASLNYSDFVYGGDFNANNVKANWSSTTPRIVLSWAPRRDFMAYGSVTEGFTPGGFNADASAQSTFTTPFKPETVTNYEAGIKTQWLDNRLRFNASLFDMKYKDKQELLFNSSTYSTTILNASKATITGAELELTYKATNWLKTGLTYSHLDGRYDEFVSGSTNYTGNPLANSPPNQFTAAANINVPIGWGYLVGAINYAWVDSYNTGAANSPQLQIPSYGLLNLNLGIESQDHRLRLMAWIKNASNTDYILTRSTQGVLSQHDGEPRTFGLTLSEKF